MNIPAAFSQLLVWLDFETLYAFPESEPDPIGFALEQLSASDRMVVKQFLINALETLQAPKQLEELHRDAGARTYFENEQGLRAYLKEIVRKAT